MINLVCGIIILVLGLFLIVFGIAVNKIDMSKRPDFNERYSDPTQYKKMLAYSQWVSGGLLAIEGLITLLTSINYYIFLIIMLVIVISDFIFIASQQIKYRR